MLTVSHRLTRGVAALRRLWRRYGRPPFALGRAAALRLVGRGVSVAGRSRQRAGKIVALGARPKTGPRPVRDLAVALGLGFMLLFVSPLTDWWLASEAGWLTPYGLWGGFIGLVYLVSRSADDDL